MLQRYPKAFENIPAVKLHHAGKSVVAWFRSMDKHDKEEGFLTENTLVFLLKGVKHIHLGEEDIVAHAGDLILLKRGAYFMTDYITDGSDYQSLMLCTDDALLRSFISEDAGFNPTDHIARGIPSAPMVIPCSRKYCRYATPS